MNRAQRRRSAAQMRQLINDHPFVRAAAEAYVGRQARAAGLPRDKIGGVRFADSAWARDDRRWFRANPRRSHRVRMALPGEFKPEPEPDFVVVRQISRGSRARRPFTIASCAADSVERLAALITRGFEEEGAAHLLFDFPGGRLVRPEELMTLIAAYENATDGVN